MGLKTLLIILLLALLTISCTGQRTNFVDEDSKIVNFAEKAWYKDNIPFLEVPDEAIEAVYYYRWSSLKRHLRYTLPGAGFIVTEFVHKVGYSQKFDTINAAAGHHIDEAKWLRNSRYVKDYINVWAREGAGNQQYSEWIADASYNAYLLNGDDIFIKSQLEGLVNNFRGWEDRFEPALNLYFISPHDDAMEHSASSEQTNDPYHGGLGYRPSFNSEMYGNALAIANIARMSSDLETAAEFEKRAMDIRTGILNHLWDNERKFFYHVFREDNPSLDLLDTREEIGFFPWRFGVPTKDNLEYETAWESLFDFEGFNSPYGPTTCEQRSQWFDGNQTSQCCFWNGNSWPYSTGHTLRSLAAQVKNYRPTVYATVDTFHQLLNQYARTQYKDGSPYVAECHSPLTKLWVCDGRNHSEHYAHSTYNDNVLADLIGIEPRPDDIFQVNPLVPSTWNYFIAENVPYHGHNITVLYDRDGTKYATGNVGLQVYVNGQFAGSRPDVGIMKVSIPSPIYPERPEVLLENYASNVNGFGYPMATTSSRAPDSNAWQAVDGRIFYDPIPSNRWSNWGNDITETDWFSVDFGPGRKKVVNEVKLYIFSDILEGGECDCPTHVSVEYFDDSTSTWATAQNQSLVPAACVRNDVWSIVFSPVTTQRIRVLFTNNIAQGTWIGITELEIWSPWPAANTGVYEAEDGYLDQLVNIMAGESASAGSYVESLYKDSFIEFTGVWINDGGFHSVLVNYANGGTNDVVMNLLVNNVHDMNVTLPVTNGGWNEFNPEDAVHVIIPLSRGNNVLIFKNIGTNSVQFDSITVR